MVNLNSSQPKPHAPHLKRPFNEGILREMDEHNNEKLPGGNQLQKFSGRLFGTLLFPSGQSQAGADLTDEKFSVKKGVKKIFRQTFMELLVLRRTENVGKIGMHKACRGGRALAHDGPFAENIQGLFRGTEPFDDRVLLIDLVIIVGVKDKIDGVAFDDILIGGHR